MVEPVTLSALASSVATGAASAIGAEMGKDVYRAVNRGLSYCQCHSQEVMEVGERISSPWNEEEMAIFRRRDGVLSLIE